MRQNTSLSLLSAALLAATLAVGGCKSSTPASSTQASQPAPATGADAQSAAQTTGAQPAASSASPSASKPAASGGSAPAQSAAAPTPQAPPPPVVVELPAGTHLSVRLDSELSSGTAQPGDAFHATVSDDVVINGQTIIARGARAEGTVTDAKALGKFKGGAVLALRLDRVQSEWGSVQVQTSSIDRAEKGKGKRTAGFVGGGAGLGALIGGLAGGGKGAAIGAIAGAGAGTAGSAFTGNHQIVLPAETLLSFKLQEPVHITENGAPQQPTLQQR